MIWIVVRVFFNSVEFEELFGLSHECFLGSGSDFGCHVSGF